MQQILSHRHREGTKKLASSRSKLRGGKTGILLVAALILITIAFESRSIVQDWENPRYYVPGRHQLWPGNIEAEKLFAEGLAGRPFIWRLPSDFIRQDTFAGLRQIKELRVLLLATASDALRLR
ncbi:MAG: hypothetical protein NTV34_01430 [Proteobacteria bacterium]|nr:hypothetical protein [Pseudomonadota bacterium]